jgi:hypothetical protein
VDVTLGLSNDYIKVGVNPKTIWMIKFMKELRT